MKLQFKLIKVYPNSPELGRIEWYDNNVKTGLCCSEEWKGSGFYNKNPEFWQKVEELVYEIISYETDKVYPWERLHIQSVKRLSDGEVFSIGDNIDSLNNCPIYRIEIIDEPLKVKGIWFFYSAGTCSLGVAKKVIKNPLFTTEDGVSIFENDKYYFISNGFQVVKSFAENLEFLSSSKTFSTKEKADEYVLLNKPLLSLTDVKDLFIKYRVELTLERLKSLIKSKL
jgi:hypothetical protein